MVLIGGGAPGLPHSCEGFGDSLYAVVVFSIVVELACPVPKFGDKELKTQCG